MTYIHVGYKMSYLRIQSVDFLFPDFPILNFGVKAVMKTSVLLTWDLPQNYKAQVPFKVSGKNT